ncbi:MAG: type IX secretion system outer membrane channel protein PorV [Dysgonamonadaceae bacterium]|jgi:hypothetical protein|nr:type IX secretion system outer membrane channel protein PorV [Dysgonamonadaceae bacterium]
MSKTVKTFICLLIASIGTVSAQTYNVIPVAVPSLQIAPDARGGGMGDIGAATTPDVYSQHWNPAKYTFAQSSGGFSFSYTPWLRKLVDDMYLLYASGYWQFGQNNENAVSFSIRNFSLGEVDVIDMNGDFWQTVAPYEFSIDAAFSRKLTETFSGAIAVRYIFADYPLGYDEITPGNAFAVDLAGYNQSNVRIGQADALLGLGFNISNIGTKISYDGGARKMFLPTNMRLGTSLGFPIDTKNNISFNLDLNKLLVPTPQLPKDGETPEETRQRIDKYNNISPIAGIFKSFGDAPGGFREEMQEISWSFGTEYIYNKQFSLRAGYFNESKWKGNRSYMAFGAGFRQSMFQIDAAYLVATNQSNPLDQTLRFSLGIDIEGLRKLF